MFVMTSVNFPDESDSFHSQYSCKRNETVPLSSDHSGSSFVCTCRKAYGPSSSYLQKLVRRFTMQTFKLLWKLSFENLIQIGDVVQVKIVPHRRIFSPISHPSREHWSVRAVDNEIAFYPSLDLTSTNQTANAHTLRACGTKIIPRNPAPRRRKPTTSEKIPTTRRN